MKTSEKQESFIRENFIMISSIRIVCTFTWEFPVGEFSVCSSVHCNSQKSVYYCLVITLKVRILFDMKGKS